MYNSGVVVARSDRSSDHILYIPQFPTYVTKQNNIEIISLDDVKEQQCKSPSIFCV